MERFRIWDVSEGSNQPHGTWNMPSVDEEVNVLFYLSVFNLI